jgi:trans-aconitate 2-methyltransferase
MSASVVATWDPAQYERFADARLRPAIDLLARIPPGPRRTIYDLGCGSGAVTRLLAEHYPGAAILGLDSSEAMLAKAQEAVPTARFAAADLAVWTPPQLADLIVANAALHWIVGHRPLMVRLLGSLQPGGVFAVQMPRNHAAQSHTAIAAVVHTERWAARLAGVRSIAPVDAAVEYLRLLSPHASSVEAWETEYVHVLSGNDPVMEWTKGTALRPYLDALDSDATAFLAEYSARLRAAYPPEADGRTLFPFRRAFIVAVR